MAKGGNKGGGGPKGGGDSDGFIRGNRKDNLLEGSDISDTIEGREGNDTLEGGGGEDEDVGRFSGTFGSSTSGSASLEFDFSALGIPTGEDIDALSFLE